MRHLDSFDITDNSDSGDSSDRNKHVCKTLQQFVSAIGIIKDTVAMGLCCVIPCY